MTARMMALVAADVRAWLDLGIPFQHVGINVSSADMHGGMLDRLLAVAFEKEGDRLAQPAVEALRAKGLRVALDDFGTGYASLTHLLTVPVDSLKIDKSFVARLAPGDASMAIVEGLIQIAGKLEVRVIAEGVETEDQARELQSAG